MEYGCAIVFDCFGYFSNQLGSDSMQHNNSVLPCPTIIDISDDSDGSAVVEIACATASSSHALMEITDSEAESGGDSDHEDSVTDNVLWPTKPLAARWMLEMFSPPRVVPIFQSMGGHGLSKDSDGIGMLRGNAVFWDADSLADRAALTRWQKTMHPCVVLGCPPCTMYSKLQDTNKKKMRPGVFEERLKHADLHMDFQMSVFCQQHADGNGFLFEHPAQASSWKKSSVLKVRTLPGVFTVTFDQCVYGLQDVEGNPLKKSTTLMSNMQSVWNEFAGKLCTCSVPHGQCQGVQHGVKISRHAQVYPPRLAAAFARCCAQHAGLTMC